MLASQLPRFVLPGAFMGRNYRFAWPLLAAPCHRLGQRGRGGAGGGLDLQRPGVAEALADALAGPGDELFGLVEHEVGIYCMVPRAVLEDRGKDRRVIGL